MSATEWKFVPVEPTANMESVGCQGYMDADGMIGIMHNSSMGHAYRAMLDDAPVPPSVEILLENWTPSEQKAFAKFRDEHFPGEMDSYAIQSLGSAWKDGQANAQPQPAAHLTIPGALEWDGDNGTHGVVGTHGADGELRAHGESSELEQLRKKTALTMGVGCGAGQLFVHGDYESIKAAQAIVLEGERLRAELANTEQSRRSFFDLSQDLEKRLASLKAFGNEMIAAAFEGGSFDGGDIQDIAVKNGLLQIEQRTEECGEVCACREYGFPAECYRKTDLLKPAAPAKCESCGGWGHIETEDSAHDCPECGPSVIERAVEAGVMNAPSKPKTCIECDQPYCHGVCVERGDQDYDRDQAAKGGCDE